MTDTTTLAPCPFCGGCAVHFHYSGSACVGCKDCIAYLGGEESDLKPDALAEAWNRRAPAPAPTDAEIEELLISCGMCWAERSFWQLEDADLHPAIRAVLARWGAPAPANGEPVALRYRMHGDLQWQYTESPDQASHADVIQRLATTAQEVRTPLDERDILQRAAGHSHPGTAGYDIELARFVESAHGITAAQKETP